jgi:hypothetical protein
MPIILVGSSFYCFPLWGVVGLGCRVFFLWLDNEQQRKLVVCAQPGFVTLCGLWIFLALLGWGYFTSTESLILAQDERWRRA